MSQTAIGLPVRWSWRARLTRLFCQAILRVCFRLRVEGAHRFATGPAIYCFNHLNWIDPFLLIAVLPTRPAYALFGPREQDMSAGARNRLIAWTGLAIPYRPAKDDLLETTRRVSRVLAGGWVIAIAGEGRIHRGERDLLPLAEGTAYFALRTGVPVIPLAINGTSWLGVGRGLRVRVGDPIPAQGRPSREAVASLTARIEQALRGMVGDFPDPAEPGRFGRWLTEVFNDWPEGARPVLGSGDAAAAGSVHRPLSGPLVASCSVITATRPGEPVGATGLSADATEYRARLAEQPDAQIDTWAAEMMRDVAIRRGVARVVEDFRQAAKLSEREFERVFASGGGPPATIGRDADGRQMVPAVALWALVPGIRSQVADGRERLIEYLVANFHEIVYV